MKGRGMEQEPWTIQAAQGMGVWRGAAGVP